MPLPHETNLFRFYFIVFDISQSTMHMLVTCKQSSGFIIPSSAFLQGVWHIVNTQYISDEQTGAGMDEWMDV